MEKLWSEAGIRMNGHNHVLYSTLLEEARFVDSSPSMFASLPDSSYAHLCDIIYPRSQDCGGKARWQSLNMGVLQFVSGRASSGANSDGRELAVRQATGTAGSTPSCLQVIDRHSASFDISYLAKKPHYGGRISHGRASDGHVSHGPVPYLLHCRHLVRPLDNDP